MGLDGGLLDTPISLGRGQRGVRGWDALAVAGIDGIERFDCCRTRMEMRVS